jgi:beta-lactam-binding protein with PASTA domain
VVGYDRVRAERMLTDNGLGVGSVTEQDSTQRSGTVLRTDPRADTMVRSGSSVDLVLAKCADRSLPNVVGYDRGRAEQMLTDNGLGVGSVTEQDSTQRTGTVLRTDPAADIVVRCGSRVNLTIAKAPVLRAVPNVVGYDQAMAQRILTQQGFSIGSVTQQESNQRARTVLQTTPTAGTQAQPGSRINLTIAKAPVLRAVPNVVGYDQAMAQPGSRINLTIAKAPAIG